MCWGSFNVGVLACMIFIAVSIIIVKSLDMLLDYILKRLGL